MTNIDSDSDSRDNNYKRRRKKIVNSSSIIGILFLISIVVGTILQARVAFIMIVSSDHDEPTLNLRLQELQHNVYNSNGNSRSNGTENDKTFSVVSRKRMEEAVSWHSSTRTSSTKSTVRRNVPKSFSDENDDDEQETPHSSQVIESSSSSFSSYSTSSTTLSTRSSPIVAGPIFYNIYIPRNNTKNAHRIIREQLKQIQQSLLTPVEVGSLQYISSNENAGINTSTTMRKKDGTETDDDVDNDIDSVSFNNNASAGVVYRQPVGTADVVYNLIGNKRSASTIQRICQRSHPQINCTLNRYLNTGNEVDTLQTLWEYCVADPGENQVVTYIHDKGSFNPRKQNTVARRHTTRAALECRNLMMAEAEIEDTSSEESRGSSSTKTTKSHCNFCSYRFHVLPNFHARSNMWSARCDYIRQLLPPQTYEKSVREMLSNSVLHPTLNQTKYACITPWQPKSNNKTYSELFWGTGRYAAERWALNHPQLNPCDCVHKKQRQLDHDVWAPKLIRSPQSKARREGIQSYKTTWERLHGRIFEWYMLYNKSRNRHRSQRTTGEVGSDPPDSYHRDHYDFEVMKTMMKILNLLPPQSSWVWKYYKGYETGTKEYLDYCHQL